MLLYKCVHRAGEAVWQRRVRRLIPALYVCASLLLPGIAGCVLHNDLNHPDPAVKIPGIAEAVKERKHDNKTLATLIKDLDSDDAAVRLYAISALERLTGNRFDYEYYAPDEQRAAAVARWRTWLAEQVKAPANAETPARTAGNQMGG